MAVTRQNPGSEVGYVTITLPVEHRLLTVEEYTALGDDESLRNLELLEGNLVMTPTAMPPHMFASNELNAQLRAQLPADLLTFYEIDLDLQLAPPDQPGTVRQPDLLVVTRAEFERSKRERRILQAGGTVLVVEIVSPGSTRTDRIIKRREYADARIRHYWIIDLEPQPSLIACELVDGSYEDGGPATGTFTAEAPFPLSLDLSALT